MTISRIPSVEGGIQPTLLTAKGDLISATAASTVARLAVGSDAQILVADSSTATGLKWATPTATTFPAFRAYQSTGQTITANTFTKINFQTENFDTDGCFASNRFTPTKAGKYFFHTALDLSSISARYVYFYKNGTNVGQIFFNSPSSRAAMNNSLFYDMNGTTDYMEVYVYIDASTTVQNGGEYTYFEGFGVIA